MNLTIRKEAPDDDEDLPNAGEVRYRKNLQA